jgi:hypothetical protein
VHQWALKKKSLLGDNNILTHGQLRHQIVQFLSDNPCTLEGSVHLRNFLPDITWEAYLQSMAKVNTFGDHLTPKAAAQAGP